MREPFTQWERRYEKRLLELHENRRFCLALIVRLSLSRLERLTQIIIIVIIVYRPSSMLPFLYIIIIIKGQMTLNFNLIPIQSRLQVHCAYTNFRTEYFIRIDNIMLT